MEQRQPEFNLSEYLHIIKNRREVIAIFFCVTVFVVTVGSFLMRPVYRATVTLLVDLESPNVLNASDASMALGSTNYYTYKEYLQSQIEIVKSRSIARQVLDEFKLGETKEYRRSKDPIKKFLKNVSVDTIRDTRLMNLSVDNRNPNLAAELANRLAAIYVDRNLAYIAKSEIINLHKNEYLKLQAKLAEYSKVYKDKHPKMIRLKEEIAQLATLVKEEQEKAAGSRFSSSGGEMDVSSAFLSGLKANNITIQDAADIPTSPIKPKKRLNILMSLFVGLFGGIGLAFFLEFLEGTVKGIEDVDRLVKWPFLGNVPKIDGTGSETTEIQRDIFVHSSPLDPVSEAYRAIRTSVLFSSTEEHPLRAIIVTSPGPQEGKTTTLCNLAIAMAQNQKKVLLVDADMRKPRLHEIFKNKNKAGLSSYLSGQAAFDELVQNTDIENLSLITGGPFPPNPSELLSSHKMKEFIEAAKKKFDFILVDTPPIAVVTDAAILSRALDGTIIVLQSGKTSIRALPWVNQTLKDARGRIIGVLINQISPELTSYQYYHYYGKKSTKQTLKETFKDFFKKS
ncbi:MAG: polysaccharide biosynthesis tyrosine autokinase [Candidatus Omnitrophica bacterium]|nr:polysaccharide biosynthesis tyrosine autokinase [Candidatus Omnitrophota bacterium]